MGSNNLKAVILKSNGFVELGAISRMIENSIYRKIHSILRTSRMIQACDNLT